MKIWSAWRFFFLICKITKGIYKFHGYIYIYACLFYSFLLLLMDEKIADNKRMWGIRIMSYEVDQKEKLWSGFWLYMYVCDCSTKSKWVTLDYGIGFLVGTTTFPRPTHKRTLWINFYILNRNVSFIWFFDYFLFLIATSLA